MVQKSGLLGVIQSWLTKLKDAYPAIETTNGILIAVAALIGALGVIGTPIFWAWRWYNDPRDSVISIVYQGIGIAPVVSALAKNDGTQAGTVVQGMILVAWQDEKKNHEFGVQLRIGTPEVIPPEACHWSFRYGFQCRFITMGIQPRKMSKRF